jgi:hypothetical protein
MNMQIPNFKLRMTNFRRPGNTVAPAPSERGMALVITLILLSVTLVMAIAFLALARRERSAVSTTTDTAAARLAADAALASAQAQIAANILGTASLGAYNYGLLVSTNFINAYGYVPTLQNVTNVNYDFRADGQQYNANDLIQNIANLYLLPRVPVYVFNRNTSSNDFRFYLDLNRNGQFEGNGSVSNVFYADGVLTTNGTLNETGDPEWIGILEHPDQPHGPNNHFVARYAFLAQPVGNGLDLNYIHNQTITENAQPSAGSVVPDGYFRNEGIGSWELNLAAFFSDLNTNEWGQIVGSGLNAPAGANLYYEYNEPAQVNYGSAFNDAQSLLSWRYGYNYNSLAGYLTTSPFYSALVFGGIDGYTIGTLITNFSPPTANLPLNTSWAGSDNTNRFYALPSELFNPAQASANFTTRLSTAGAQPDTYDRYTFYRLLDALGTDTTADDGKMNLNYRNITNGAVVVGAETNAIPWTPVDFFTNAADRLLKYYTASWYAADKSANHFVFTNTFGVTNSFGVGAIPVYVNGQFVYTPAVNRLLQLAANLYDATTTNFFPSVFRPVFNVMLSSNSMWRNVYICGYEQVVLNGAIPYLAAPINVEDLAIGTSIQTNIYGVPWVIGAKKGLPNFNEFAMENTLTVTRRLQFTRQINSGAPPTILSTNQMYMFSLNSSFGIELWNSYTNNYVGQIWAVVNDLPTLAITNDEPSAPNPLYSMTTQSPFVYATNFWVGCGPKWINNGVPNSGALVPLVFSGPTLSNAVYRSRNVAGNGNYVPSPLVAPGFVPTNYFNVNNNLVLDFEQNSPDGFYFPHFGLNLTNRLQFYMLAYGNGVTNVIDYVSFAGPNGSVDVNKNLVDPDNGGGATPNYGVWNTNYPANSTPPTGPTWGILSQIAASKSGVAPTEDGKWVSDPQSPQFGGDNYKQAAYFNAFFSPNNRASIYDPLVAKSVTLTNQLFVTQAPYSPTRSVVQYFSWQANDPLVHYLASDLRPSSDTTKIPQPGVNHYNPGQTVLPLTGLNLGLVNDRYTPWGGSPVNAYKTLDPNTNNLAERDPGIRSSDNWDFPNYKLPTVGWIGRVHRGTPWQTVYFKATDFLANNNFAAWTNWIGSGNLFDATNAAPVADHALFELFTTRFDDNATRGTLSVNHGASSYNPNNNPAAGLEAWSAVFSGMTVPTSLTNTYTVISPAGVFNNPANSPLAMLVTNINATRATLTNGDGLVGTFEHIGDILRAPALTEQSPFITPGLSLANETSDELYEWLPQQMMSLLRVSTTPRYVVYCYGQSLRPASGGTVTSAGQFFGLVTNYQIMAESAARAVVRVGRTITTNNVGTPVGTNYSTVIESYNVLGPN